MTQEEIEKLQEEIKPLYSLIAEKIADKEVAITDAKSLIEMWKTEALSLREAQLAKPDRLMDKEKLEKRIAELFRIAREEGPIRKWADGISDAKEILALIDPKQEGK